MSAVTHFGEYMQAIVVAKLTSREFVVGRLMGGHIFHTFLLRFDIDRDLGITHTGIIPYMSPISNNCPVISMDKVIVYEDAPTELKEMYLNKLGALVGAKNITPESPKDEQNDRSNGVYKENTPETGRTGGPINFQ